MSLNIVEAIQDGFDRATSVPAAIIAVVILAIGLASTVLSSSLIRTVLLENEAIQQAIEENPDLTYEEFSTMVGTQNPFDFVDAAPEVMGLGLLALLIFGFLFNFGVVRWFVEGDQEGLHAGLFTRRLLWTAGNMLLGMILLAVIVGVIPLVILFAAGLLGGGLVALLALLVLIVPVVYLYTALYFYSFDIIVEGSNAIDALGNSWELTKGNRLLLFFLGALFVLASLVIGFVVSAVTSANVVVNVLTTQVINTAMSVLSIAVAAAAYNQLRGVEQASSGAPGPDDL